MFRAIWAAYAAPWSVQAQVDARAGSGAGCHVAVVHEEHVRVYLHLGEGGGELGGAAPVGGGAAAVEQSGLGEDEGPRADGDDPRPALVGSPQRLGDGRRHRCAERLPARDDHGVRLLQGRQPRVDEHREADGGLQRAGALGAGPEAVAGRHVLLDGAEDLGGTGELEGRLGRVEQGHHPMEVHGRNIPVGVFLDSRPGGRPGSQWSHE
jgi:hypothetical protein